MAQVIGHFGVNKTPCSLNITVCRDQEGTIGAVVDHMLGNVSVWQQHLRENQLMIQKNSDLSHFGNVLAALNGPGVAVRPTPLGHEVNKVAAVRAAQLKGQPVGTPHAVPGQIVRNGWVINIQAVTALVFRV